MKEIQLDSDTDLIYPWQNLGIGKFNVPIDSLMLREEGTIYQIPCHFVGDPKSGHRQIRSIRFDRTYVIAKLSQSLAPILSPPRTKGDLMQLMSDICDLSNLAKNTLDLND